MAKSRSNAILTSGPMAFAIADITTCKPEVGEREREKKNNIWAFFVITEICNIFPPKKEVEVLPIAFLKHVFITKAIRLF